jgi:hypothetical protein
MKLPRGRVNPPGLLRFQLEYVEYFSMQKKFGNLLTKSLFLVNWLVTYTTVSPLTVVRNMVKPGVPPNAGLLF